MFEERARAAILGQFAGDALCLGTHWIYDPAEAARRWPEGIHGFEEPAADHWHAGRRAGEPTHYGEAGLVLLEHLAEDGDFDPGRFAERFVAHFSAPARKGYLDRPTRGAIERWRQADAATRRTGRIGIADTQTVTLVRLAPLVVALHGTPDLETAVERCTRVTQDDDFAVACALFHTRLLGRLLDGAALEEALAEAAARAPGAIGDELRALVRAAREQRRRPIGDATAAFGRACPLVQTLPSCLHAVLHDGPAFPSAILESCRALGDNAARCAVLGQWIGAAAGGTGIPGGWIARLAQGRRIERLLGIVVARSRPRVQ